MWCLSAGERLGACYCLLWMLEGFHGESEVCLTTRGSKDHTNIRILDSGSEARDKGARNHGL